MHQTSKKFLVSLFTLIFIYGGSSFKAEVLVDRLMEPQEILENVKLLSSPLMKGRGVKDDGHLIAGDFLTERLKAYQILPFGDDEQNSRSYRQKITGKSWFDESQIESYNILGYIEGQDKSRVIIVGAHYDHLGTIKGVIYPGADDNASGTAVVLAIAKVYGELLASGVKPKSSIIIAFWGAEESGLIGSKYFVKNPPTDIVLSNIVTMINFDMVGRGEDDRYSCTLTPIEQNPKINSPTLYSINETVSRKFRLHTNYNGSGLTYRSGDYAPFFYALASGNRIPIINYFTGMHQDYHRPTDTFEKLNYQKLATIAKIAFLTSWYISELPERPIYKDIDRKEGDGESFSNCRWYSRTD